MCIAQYKKDKEDCFKNLVSMRKKELEYKTPKKNNTDNNCEGCLFFNAFSPSLNRCSLISYEMDFLLPEAVPMPYESKKNTGLKKRPSTLNTR